MSSKNIHINIFFLDYKLNYEQSCLPNWVMWPFRDHSYVLNYMIN